MKEFKCTQAGCDTITCSSAYAEVRVRIEIHELDCPEGTFVLLSPEDARAMAAELVRLAGEG